MEPNPGRFTLSPLTSVEPLPRRGDSFKVRQILQRFWAHILALLLVLTGGILPLPAAEAAGVDEVLALIQARYGKAGTLIARFEQVDSSGMTEGYIQKGEVSLKEPGKMRWDYREPQERMFLSDGKVLWMWTPALKQVIRHGSLDPKAAARIFDFLHGLSNVKEDYRVSLEAGSKESHVLVLQPITPEVPFARVTLSFHRTTLDIQKAVMVDALGNISTTTFSDVKLGVPLDDSRFRFVPPPGVEVIDAG